MPDRVRQEAAHGLMAPEMCEVVRKMDTALAISLPAYRAGATMVELIIRLDAGSGALIVAP